MQCTVHQLYFEIKTSNVQCSIRVQLWDMILKVKVVHGVEIAKILEYNKIMFVTSRKIVEVWWRNYTILIFTTVLYEWTETHHFYLKRFERFKFSCTTYLFIKVVYQTFTINLFNKVVYQTFTKLFYKKAFTFTFCSPLVVNLKYLLFVVSK